MNVSVINGNLTVDAMIREKIISIVFQSLIMSRKTESRTSNVQDIRLKISSLLRQTLKKVSLFW